MKSMHLRKGPAPCHPERRRNISRFFVAPLLRMTGTRAVSGLTLINNRGLTLLEVLVAIAILSFGLLAIATMQASSIKGNSQAIGLTEAITLAQDKVEELMRLPYDDATLDDGAGTNDGVAGLDDNRANSDQQDPSNPVQVGGSGRDFYLYWNVAVNQPINNVKTVRIVVEWQERGRWRNATVDYMKADII